MLTVYFNYPESRISIHRNSDCNEIKKREKTNQREVHIDSNNMDAELERFKRYPFASVAEINDMWVMVNLDGEASEMKIINKIKQILGRYKPFDDAKIEWHSCTS